jgi:hypothetical protein
MARLRFHGNAPPDAQRQAGVLVTGATASYVSFVTNETAYSAPAPSVPTLLGVYGVYRLFAVLIGITLLLGYVRSYLELSWEMSWNSLLPVISLDYESGLASWVSSMLFAVTGYFMLVAGHGDRGRQLRTAGGWLLLGCLFLYFSLDEALSLHEALDNPGRRFSIGDVRLGWALFGIPALLVGLVVFLPFVRRLPTRTAQRLVIAGAVYVVGVLGIDLVDGFFVDTEGRGVGSEIAADIEESLEMIGLWLGMRTTLLYLAEHAPAFAFVARTPK